MSQKCPYSEDTPLFFAAGGTSCVPRPKFFERRPDTSWHRAPRRGFLFSHAEQGTPFFKERTRGRPVLGCPPHGAGSIGVGAYADRRSAFLLQRARYAG